MIKTTNYETPYLISQRLDFTGSNFTGYNRADGSYVIYSYNAKIAEITTEGIVWITTRWHSNTTARHLSYVKRALDSRDVVWSYNLDRAKTTTKWRDLVVGN
jgi:hypothetical protein